MLGNATTDHVADTILAATESINRLLDDPSVQVVQIASNPEPD